MRELNDLDAFQASNDLIQSFLVVSKALTSFTPMSSVLLNCSVGSPGGRSAASPLFLLPFTA